MWTVPTDGKAGRRPVNFRASWTAVERLDAQAIREGLVDEGGEPNRSELIRIMLAYADRNMPKGWRP